jgi:ComF family protein
MDCLDDLPVVGACCERCGIRMPQAAAICGRCLLEPFLADRTVTAYEYRYPVDALIKAMKYRHCLRLAVPMSRALARRIMAGAEPLPEVMIPVPLHHKRLYRRGFNQSYEICRRLYGYTHIPVDLGSVSRTRHTSPMFDLTVRQRRENITGAFKLLRPLNYRSVAIVDDVITSGATVNELARLLRRAGVNFISCWALARAE